MQKIAILVGSGVGLLIVFGLLFAFLFSGGITIDDQLGLASRLIDEGRWEVASRIAREIDQSQIVTPETDATWNYVSGASTIAGIANDSDSPRNRRELKKALLQLKKAAELGFPVGFQGKGQFYLGWCYYYTHDWKNAAETLKKVPEMWPARRSEAWQLIVSALVRMEPPAFDDAQASIAQWEAIPGLSKSERGRVLLAKTHIAFAQDEIEKCAQYLDALEENSPEAVEGQIWRCRCRIAIASSLPVGDRSREQNLQEAEAVIDPLVRSAETQEDISRQANYLMGRIFHLQQRLNDAIGKFSGIRQDKPQSAEAIAASMEEAEIFFEIEDYTEGVATCHLLLEGIEDIALYNGYWIPATELRARLLELGRILRSTGNFGLAIQLAQHLSSAFPLADSVRLQAEAYEDWGNELAAAAPRNASESLSKQYQESVENKYNSAGMQYEQLASLEFKSPEYPQLLWQAVVTYEKSNDLYQTARLLDIYLEAEEHSKRPRGYLATGKNYMNAGQWNKAIPPLDRCLEQYPGHPIQFEVRFLAAKARVELDELDAATELLESNLFDYDLLPGSPIWQDSISLLGHVHYRQGDRELLEAAGLTDLDQRLKKVESSRDHFLSAIQRLGHAVAKSADDASYFEDYYTIAKANRRMAKAYDLLVGLDGSLVDSARRQLQKQSREHLERALQNYIDIREELFRQQSPRNKSQQDSIVRNCYFGEADILFDLERWGEAATAYRAAAGRYMNQPSAIEALVQMANCHFKQGTNEEGKKILVQAEQVLNRIPAEFDPQFEELTRASRDGWRGILDRLKRWN